MENPYPWEQVWVDGRYATNAKREKKAKRKLDAFQSMQALPTDLGRVVEIGCGNSAFIRKALDRGSRISSYIGVDLSQTALKRAELNLDGIANTSLILGDAKNLPIPDACADTILSLGVIEHIHDIKLCLAELHRIAAPGAKLLLATSNTLSTMHATRLIREAVGVWPYGFQRNDSIESLGELLQPVFKISCARVLHGDNDFIFSTALDRIIGLFHPQFGRYVLCEAIAS